MKKSHPNLKLAEECLALIEKHANKKVVFTTKQLIEQKIGVIPSNVVILESSRLQKYMLKGFEKFPNTINAGDIQIKLCNRPELPAERIEFSKKHKYSTQRDLTEEKAIRIAEVALQRQMREAMEAEKKALYKIHIWEGDKHYIAHMEKFGKKKLAELSKAFEEIKEKISQAKKEGKELFTSSYRNNYQYAYVHIGYLDEHLKGQSKQVHLLSEVNKNKTILNVIFLDYGVQKYGSHSLRKNRKDANAYGLVLFRKPIIKGITCLYIK